jgi:4-amino-4-deoxy-L-arabinose transferase-like glycosyltransferase
MKDYKTVLLLWVVGLIYRIMHYVLFSDWVVAYSDPMQNILLARNFSSGNFYGVLDTYWPPLYGIIVGTVGFFSDDLILPALIVSIFSGSLAVPLTYYLTRQSFGHKESVIAAIFAIFYPFLINSVIALGLENIYLVVIIGALIVGWKAIEKESAILFFFTGTLLGLAYLTKPEAFAYPLFFVGIIFVKHLVQKRLFDRTLLIKVFALVIGFAIFAAPYILYLKQESGTWMISGKTAKNFAVGVFEDSMEENSSSPPMNSETTIEIIKIFGLGLRDVQDIFKLIVPIPLIFLLALGLFSEKWDKKRFNREAYLILFCFLTIVGYALSVVIYRYFYVLIPIVLGWVAHGIVHLEKWFKTSVEVWYPNKILNKISSKSFIIILLIFIYIYVFPINFYVRSTKSAWQSAAFEERDAGVWLKENSQSSPVIFSASYRPVFYAHGKQFWLETEDHEELLRKIKASDVQFVVDSERIYKKYEYLKGFSDSLQKDPQFMLIYERNEQPGYKISIYKRK